MIENEQAIQHLNKLLLELYEKKIINIKDLVKNTPNDADLGRIMRQLINEDQKCTK